MLNDLLVPTRDYYLTDIEWTFFITHWIYDWQLTVWILLTILTYFKWH